MVVMQSLAVEIGFIAARRIMFTYDPMFGVSLGCDPEIFLSREVGRVRKRKSIIGSEVVIPEKGLAATNYYGNVEGSIVRDGVQVELHPAPTSCRANLSNSLQVIFRSLSQAVNEAANREGKSIKIDFTPVVRMSPGDLAKLSPPAQELGCKPSKNIYGRKFIQKDGRKYLYRSAAGHIHIGSDMFKNKSVAPEDVIRFMDLVVGNTAVLIDRDSNAALRRKTYGRAGEYRTPSHGVEYRTLSNFWLHSYQLMSLVMGLTKIAVWLGSRHYGSGKLGSAWNKNKECPAQIMMRHVDPERLETAINTNDYDLAMENYTQHVRPIFAELQTYDLGIQRTSVDDFDFFLKKIREAELAGNQQPLNVWFKENPLEHWLAKPEGHGSGWESWLLGTVQRARLRETIAAKKMEAVVAVPTTIVEPQGTPIIGPIVEPIYKVKGL
jgi:hypothetical protein